MKIKTTETVKINTILNAVNADAITHTGNAYTVAIAADKAEAKLDSFNLPKKSRKGARAVVTTGGTVPSAYKYNRIVTQFTIERGASDWFLIDAKRIELYQSEKGGMVMHITRAQHDIAVAKFSEQFQVQKPAEPKQWAALHAKYLPAPDIGKNQMAAMQVAIESTSPMVQHKWDDRMDSVKQMAAKIDAYHACGDQ